jgi:transcription elongation factor Elf1
MDTKIIPDNSGAVLRLTCPHCNTVSQFAASDAVDVYLCPACGEAIEVDVVA